MTAFSIVIPAKNEAENITELLTGIASACDPLGAYEIIVVDDASDDGMAGVLASLRPQMPQLRVLRHDRSGGQSAAVHSGVRASVAPLIATLDGDGQNPPHELPNLLAPLLNDTTGRLGLVAGQRVGRQDTASKRWASKFANGLRARILRDGTRDTGCGLKAFRRDGFLNLPYFDHMHRYLPALFKRDGWDIAHIDVTHRARGGGRSHYSNLQRGLVSIADLAGVAWLLRRRKKAQPTEVKG
ncbi:glycosyltransferase family 2 protein [Paracoccus sp. (in: a-proteobacteria)]|uniref:glycosyltransferase family 2 protein n=1 Tax=Paracoccus sp. TaxID=267 RepID=UPI0026DFD9CF|nr:glycosyltransferase family 2 protein [Paracoccus sp. (in: a-proteobacteria)]MDO5646992.1 glycosyltransferase family 2 protein [Paracoccus sp. (in: a-proteobacteria)]